MQPTDDDLERRRRLILLAEQVARARPPAPRPPVALVAGLAAVGVVSISAGVKFAIDAGGPAGADAGVAVTSVVPTAAPGSLPPGTTAPQVVAMAPVPPTSTPPGSEVPLPDQPARWMVLADGILHLRGRVPDLDAAQQVFSRAADVVGTASVVVEFSIVPGAPLPVDDPVHVPEIARFQPGSTALLPESAEALRDIVRRAGAIESLTIDVHPDALAADAGLDAGRTDAVRRLFIGLGLDPARVVVDQPSDFGPPVVEDVQDALSITVHGWFG